MPFDPARVPAQVDQVPFGARWRGLTELAEGTTVDVLDVGVRLAMLRALIERTNPRGALGAHDELHPLWGYAAQLAWQQRSGRLGGDGDRIDPTSWWGGCNYALTVVPYWAAMQRGIVPRLGFADPDRGYYLQAWLAWGDALRIMVEYVRDAELEPLRQAVWAAHLDSIDAGRRDHYEKHLALPAPERRFATGWMRMVELLGAAVWRTDLVELTTGGAAALPEKVLRTDADVAALPKAERATARQVLGLGERTPWRWAVEVRAWRRMMRERRERDDAKRLLAGLFGKGDDVWATRLRALKALR